MGKLKVISGIRLPRTLLLAFSDTSPFVAIALPHTRHLLAPSDNLVPQVGHNFVDEEFSVVIRFRFEQPISLILGLAANAAAIIPAFSKACESTLLVN
jgi:hypothetical protein